MLLSALALHPLLCDLRTRFKDLKLLPAYADHFNVVLPLRLAVGFLCYMQTHRPSRGSRINMRQTEAWWWGRDVCPLPCAVNTNLALTILCAPIGSAAGSLDLIQPKVHTVQRMWDGIRQLKDPQWYHVFVPTQAG